MRLTRSATVVSIIAVLVGSGPAWAGNHSPVPTAAPDGFRRAPWTAPAEATVHPVPCDDDPTFLCGSVSVPVDRADPGGRQLSVAFQIFPHTDPSAAPTEPIFVSNGGPGGSTTGNRYGYAFWMLAGAAQDHDLVMIDQRGTGRSGAIRCRDLQDGWSWGAAFYRATRRCAASLGDDADRYGSGDIAKDMDAVRRALGYHVIDSFANSYGTVVQQAYATRYPQHLHAIVADGGLPVSDPGHTWGWGLDQPAGIVRAVTLGCQRAPSCASDIADPQGTFAALVHQLTDDPLTGSGRGLLGRRHEVVVDGPMLWILGYDPYLDAEMAAAATAFLEHQDAAPLLRLAAENRRRIGPAGPVRSYSEGAHEATYCNDQEFVFDRFAPRSQREQQYLDARAALPTDTFAPWTVEDWDLGEGLGVCTQWPAPDRYVPALKTGGLPIDVPTLILSGDFDTDVPQETQQTLATMFQDPTVVVIEGAGHTSTAWSRCGQDLAQRFFDTLDVGDTSCADSPSLVFPAVARYPRSSADAVAATSASAADESRARDRRAIWSAVQTLRDAWRRAYMQPKALANGAGLRRGSFHADWRFPDHALVVLHGARFVRDIAVSGPSTMSYDDAHPRMRARIRIHGSGTVPGRLRIRARQWFDTVLGSFHVTGRIGHRTIDVTVPGN
jgi:pimeloyl-ACP methyl ester carboxylesterase